MELTTPLIRTKKHTMTHDTTATQRTWEQSVPSATKPSVRTNRSDVLLVALAPGPHELDVDEHYHRAEHGEERGDRIVRDVEEHRERSGRGEGHANRSPHAQDRWMTDQFLEFRPRSPSVAADVR